MTTVVDRMADEEFTLFLCATASLVVCLHREEQKQRKIQHQLETDRKRQRELEEERERMKLERRKRKRVREWLKKREQFGQYDKLMRELEDQDEVSFNNYLRMDPELFREILDRISHRIQKEDTNCKKALRPGLKLAATLRFLATGDSSKTLGYAFRVSFNGVSEFLIDVCQAIIDEYIYETIFTPRTQEGWKEIAELFWTRWNFPHCLGALDGKHIAMRKPKKSGSEFFNYKKFFSVVLMALVDADYKFIYIDVGATGAGSDAGIFNTSDLKDKLENNELGLPEAIPLPGDEGGRPIPYFLVGDDAFALKPWLMKPLPIRNMTKEQRIYNYRLSRARRVVENAFGILSSKFRCLLTTLQQNPERVTTITVCCCVLHNLLRLRNPASTDGPTSHDGHDNDDDVRDPCPTSLTDMNESYNGRNPTRMAKEQREYLVKYVNSEAGKVDWQDNMI